jgi:hypothetical protein
VCIGVLFVYAMIGNHLSYRVWLHYKDPHQRIGKWDLWLHPEKFTDEGQRLRRIAGRYYGAGALGLVGLFIVLRVLTR